jgi:hypothetical protein
MNFTQIYTFFWNQQNQVVVFNINAQPNKFGKISDMKFKSFLTLFVTLATIGASLPAVAGDSDRSSGSSSGSSEFHEKHNYYGNYFPYQDVYVGSKGDFFDRRGKHHFSRENRGYRYNSGYDYKRKGNYYDERGQYHDRMSNNNH